MNANARQIVFDITALRVQGATQVQSAGVRALELTTRHSKAKTLPRFRNELVQTGMALVKSRPTEPGLRTAVRVVWKTAFQTGFSLLETKKNVLEKCRLFELERQLMLHQIAKMGAKMLPKNAVVLTHCHSHTVEEMLLAARNKIDCVYCTETRPLFQGRITATNLSKAGIKTIQIIDSAASTVAKEADVFLTGSDAILANGNVINKIGTNEISLSAKRFGVPHWVATSSFSFDPLTFFGWSEPIEERSWKEIWPNKPKMVRVLNHAFDETPAEQVKQIISEFGARSPKQFVKKATESFDVLHDRKEYLQMLRFLHATRRKKT